MRTILSAIFIVIAISDLGRAADNRPAATDLSDIAPFINDQTIIVARVDLARIDFAALQKQLVEPMLRSDAERISASVIIEKLRDLAGELRTAGAGHVYLVVSTAPAPVLGVAQNPFILPPTAFLVVPGVKGNAAGTVDQLVKLLDEGVTGNVHASERLAHQTIHGSEVISVRGILDVLPALVPIDRPEVGQALAAAGDHTICMAVVPPTIFARAAAEILRSPAPGSKDSWGKILTDGIRWAAVGMEANFDKFSAHVVIQSGDATGAAALGAMLKQQLTDELITHPPTSDAASSVLIGAQLLSLLPEAKGDRLTLTLDGERGATLGALAKMAYAQSMAASWRNETQNNLKQIGLAMLNYVDKNKTLPDRAIRDKNGKALLSWRVAVLRDVEESGLFKEFHLDEPWDSEHNRKLIERMPEAYRSPDTGDSHPGRTRYLALVGEHCVFPPDRPIKLAEVRDGTSKTMMVVEAKPDQAVVWTKPDDLEVDLDNPFRGLATAKEIFNAVFCDGHVETFSGQTKPATIKALMTRDGGENIER